MAAGSQTHKTVVDVHLVLRKGGRVLLGRRQNTGFADGYFHLPAGHLEPGESVVEAAIREGAEELGVAVLARDLRLLHVMHNATGTGRVALFFEATTWRGDVKNREPTKCRDLAWFSVDGLPPRIVPYAREALEAALLRDEPLSVVAGAKSMRAAAPVPTICGLDEAGRGALAGPLVVAAVILPRSFGFAGTGLVARDSKELSTRQREALGDFILASGVVDYAVFSAREINERGINWANTYGFRRLIRRLEADRYIVDGRWRLPPLGPRADRVECVIHADEHVPAALAAGVMAKLYRDRIMSGLDRRHPSYGWRRNTGHGTAAHIEAIRQFGTTAHHRTQFVATALSGVRRRRRPGVAAYGHTPESSERPPA